MMVAKLEEQRRNRMSSLTSLRPSLFFIRIAYILSPSNFRGRCSGGDSPAVVLGRMEVAHTATNIVRGVG